MLGGVHEDIPPWLKKTEDVSIIKWGLEGLMINEFEGMEMDALPDTKQPPLLRWLLDRVAPRRLQGVVKGESVLKDMNMGGASLGRSVIRLQQLTGLFHLVTLVTLNMKRPRFASLSRAQTSGSLS
ncbi:unnamed protein product [Chrysoparadoxa australica]